MQVPKWCRPWRRIVWISWWCETNLHLGIVLLHLVAHVSGVGRQDIFARDCLATKQSWSDQMSWVSGLRTCPTWLPNKWGFYSFPKRHGVRTLGLDLTLEDEGLYPDQIMEEDLNAPKLTGSSAHTESHPPHNAIDVVVDTRTEGRGA